MSDFDVDIVPGAVWEELNSFNEDNGGDLKIESNIEKQWIKIVREGKEDGAGPLTVKMKFFDLKEE